MRPVISNGLAGRASRTGRSYRAKAARRRPLVAELGPSETRAGARPGRPDAHMRGFSARPRKVAATQIAGFERRPCSLPRGTVLFGHLRGYL